jgi:hypothetical protein
MVGVLGIVPIVSGKRTTSSRAVRPHTDAAATGHSESLKKESPSSVRDQRNKQDSERQSQPK